MPGVVRKSLDSAGGKELGGKISTVFVENANVVVVGDQVEPHGKAPHGPTPPTMVEGSSTVFIEGHPVCREGDKASCGHTASGSSTVIAA